MNEMIKKDCTTAVTEAVKNANVNITVKAIDFCPITDGVACP